LVSQQGRGAIIGAPFLWFVYERTAVRAVFLAIVLLITVSWLPTAGAVCNPPAHVDEYARVAYVYDGDTVRLQDGRKVRFIGINAPELAHDGHPAEPLAQAARQALKALLEANPRVGLRYGAQHFDHYHRVLAHLFTDKGRSIHAWLLEQGFAATIAIPPNLWYQRCYQQAERLARREKRGIWALRYYQPLPAEGLDRRVRGFHLISGRVRKLSRSRKSIWLKLDGSVDLRIARRDLPYFDRQNFARYVGQRVVARGWLHPYRDHTVLRIRYPFALQLDR